MGLWSDVVNYLKPKTPAIDSLALTPRAVEVPQPVPAGRVSMDSSRTHVGAGWTLVPPVDDTTNWRIQDLDTNNLNYYTPKQLLDMLLNLSPEINRGTWDFLRMCNPGYEYKVYNKGSDKKENKRGKRHIDSVVSMLRDRYGSFDVVLGRYFIGAYLGGAFCGELVLDGEARETVDLVAPDPYSIRFRKRIDPVRGEVWQPGQWQAQGFVPLDIPTFRYIPVDPIPTSPYGRSLAAPALFSALFLLSLMHDVKRVVMQQGYKRLDISLDMEAAEDSYTFDSQGYASYAEYVKAAIAEVKSAYRNLQPDDALIHSNIFTIGENVGTVDSASMAGLDQIIARLEKQVTRALKSNGLIMGTDNSPNETDSNRRWEIHAAGIKSLQHLCEAMLESFFTLSLQAVGQQCDVVFRFSELRASEMLRDEQTRQLRVMNSREEYKAGYVSQDEASNVAVNHDADVPAPRDTVVSTETVNDNSSGEENLEMNTDDRAQRVIDRLMEIFEL